MTIPLLLLLAGSIYMFLFTYDKVKARDQLEDTSQVTMRVLEPTATPTPKATPTPAETPTPTPEPANPEIPVLTLVADEVEVKVGQSFNVISLVKDITDDVTDRSTLFRRIRIHGDYRLQAPGEYTLEFIVSDLDGHNSEPKYLKLIVK